MPRTVSKTFEVLFAFAVSILFGSTTTFGMDFRVEYTDNRPVFPPAIWVEMSGEVEEGDTYRFLEAISPYTHRDVYEVVLNLDSPGGSLIESMRLGRTISELPYVTRANVGVEGGSQICASACVNVYLGADYRFLAENARIGVHRFSMSGANVGADDALSISQELSAEIIEYIRLMRADAAFFNVMVSAHADDILWVPRETLEALRVVTGGIYSETAEYRNINGSIALFLSQVGQFGSNTLTLMCGGRGLGGIFNFNEPELAVIGRLELYIDGVSIPLDDLDIIKREDSRLIALSLFPPDVQKRLTNAQELGARIASPADGIFFGFEGGVSDAKIAETARGCLTSLEAPIPQMTYAEGIDFTGGDLTTSGHRDITFEECQSICLANDRCIAVSYAVAQRWCWPKDRIVTTNRHSGVVSAFKELR